LKDQRICVDNFKMDIKTLVWGGVHWISQWSAAVKYGIEPTSSIKGKEFKWVSDYVLNKDLAASNVLLFGVIIVERLNLLKSSDNYI
jgi:hypothetical protein